MNRSLEDRQRISMGLRSVVNRSSFMDYSTQTEIRHFFKLIILGNVSVGKSSILRQFMEEKFDEKYNVTLSADFCVKSMLIDDNTWVEMNIWDTCGQERYRTITRQYFKDAKGCLLVFDVTNEKSFRDLKSWVEDLRENSKEDITIIVVANKTDMKERVISFKEGNQFAKSFNLDYIEVSAKSGVNINILFEILCKSMITESEYDEFKNRRKKGDRSTIDISPFIYEVDKKKEKDKSCC